MILAGIIARSIIEPKLINFDEPEVVGQSLILLGSLTSLIAGLFIALQLHIYLNNFLLELVGKAGLTNFSSYKMKVSRKKDFSSTLEEFYGNLFISIILFFMLLSFIDELSRPNVENFEYPLWNFRPPLMKLDCTIIIFLSLFLLFMMFNTIKSFNSWRNRLNFFTHHYYYLLNRDLLLKEQNEEVTNQKNWLNDYRKQFSSNWDRAEELYINRKSEVLALLEVAKTLLEDFPQEYEKRIIPENLRKYADVETKDMDSENPDAPIERIWRFWVNSVRSILDCYSYLYRLRLKGIKTFLSHNLTSEFLEFHLRVNDIRETHSEMGRRMDILIQRKFNFELAENKNVHISESDEKLYKKILLIEQFPEYDKIIEDYFHVYETLAEEFVNNIKPLVPNATHKFLEELEEEKSLSVVIEENVSIRKLHLELLENLLNNVSRDLEMLNKCIEELKPKERNKIVQLFSRL